MNKKLPVSIFVIDGASVTAHGFSTGELKLIGATMLEKIPEKKLPELIGIYIRGNIWNKDEKPLDGGDFWEKFIEFVEVNNWLYGGTMSEVDLNKDDEE